MANADALLESWVKGCILHLIDFDKTKGSYVCLDDAKQHIGLAEVWTSLNSAYRDQAFANFCNDAQLSRQFDKKFDEHLDELGKAKVKELWDDVRTSYFKEYSRCQLAFKTVFGSNISIEYKGTLQMLKQEMDALPRIFGQA